MAFIGFQWSSGYVRTRLWQIWPLSAPYAHFSGGFSRDPPPRSPFSGPTSRRHWLYMSSKAREKALIGLLRLGDDATWIPPGWASLHHLGLGLLTHHLWLPPRRRANQLRRSFERAFSTSTRSMRTSAASSRASREYLRAISAKTSTC